MQAGSGVAPSHCGSRFGFRKQLKHANRCYPTDPDVVRIQYEVGSDRYGLEKKLCCGIHRFSLKRWYRQNQGLSGQRPISEPEVQIYVFVLPLLLLLPLGYHIINSTARQTQHEARTKPPRSSCNKPCQPLRLAIPGPVTLQPTAVATADQPSIATTAAMHSAET